MPKPVQPRLSELKIDVDKDWLGYAIKNLKSIQITGSGLQLPGLTADPALAAGLLWYRSDLDEWRYSPDGATVKPVARRTTTSRDAYDPPATDKLYLMVGGAGSGAVFSDVEFADGFVLTFVKPNPPNSNFGAAIRAIDADNVACVYIGPYRATKDFYFEVFVNGSAVTSTYEAVDLPDELYIVILQATGTTYNMWRSQPDGTGGYSSMTATDANLTSGKFGIAGYLCGGIFAFAIGCEYSVSRLPSTPLRPAAYFTVPITGSGKPGDPFRALMPEEIVDDPTWGKVDRLSLTNSAVIPIQRGQPVDNYTIVRVFNTPRQPHLRPFSEAVLKLAAMKGVRKLTREEAIKEALRLDDRLHIADLEAITNDAEAIKYGFKSLKHCVKEYVKWRESLGVKTAEKEAEAYVKAYKGW